MSWLIKNLEEICKIEMGSTPSRSHKEYWGNGYKWISISDMSSKYITETKEEITDLAVNECNCKKVPANTLLMSFKLSVGKLAFTTEPMYCNEAIASLVIKNNEEIDNNYLYYALQTINLAEGVDRAAKGLTLNKAKLKKIKIPLPPIEEQRRIVEKLDIAANLCQLQKQAIEKLDKLLQSVFIDLFGDPFYNPRNWEVRDLGSLIEHLGDYHSNGSYKILRENVKLLDMPDYALMIRTTDLERNNFLDDVKYINEYSYNFLDKSKVYGDEIIINKIGSAGKVYLMPKLNRPVSLGMNQFLIRFKESVNCIFIYYMLTSKYGEHIIKQKVQGAVTKTITKDAVRKLRIPLPPLSIQLTFYEIYTKVGEMKSNYKTSIDQQEKLYKSLVQKCFMQSTLAN